MKKNVGKLFGKLYTFFTFQEIETLKRKKCETSHFKCNFHEILPLTDARTTNLVHHQNIRTVFQRLSLVA